MLVSEETYQRVALEDPESKWELVGSRLRKRPCMTGEHEDLAARVNRRLNQQLDEDEYSVRMSSGRLRVSNGNYFIPDVCVIPRAYVRRLQERPGTFEVYQEAMPLLVQVWSPSTGTFDVDDKLSEYKQRGDQEIWRIHPYERTLTAWRRQVDGGYAETVCTSGTVPVVSLPGVSIDLDRLFD